MIWKIRIYTVLIITMALTLTGCSLRDNTNKLEEGFYAGQTDSQSSGEPTDSSTESDTSTSTDSAVSSDSDSDTQSDFFDSQTTDSAVDTGADSATDSSDTDTVSDNTADSNADTVTETEIDTDTVTDSDADSGTGTANEPDTQSDDATDTASETDTPVDTDTGDNCVELGWECGDGDNLLGFYLDCDEALGCADTGEWCDDDHQCLTCDNDAHCGAGCESCGSAAPRCKNGLRCVECLSDQDCGVGTPACDTDNNVCVECVTNQQCRPEIVVVTLYDTEPDTSTETETATDTYTETATADDTEPLSFDTDTAYLFDTDKPWLSPVGVCSPDNTCSCWADGEKGECTADSDCPQGLGFRCLRDYDDGVNAHKVCLRECDSTIAEPADGLFCADKIAAFAWAPMTSCFTFVKFGTDCTADADVGALPDANKCRVSSAFGDGKCVEHPLNNNKYFCTYSCWDEDAEVTMSSWCPADYQCGIIPDTYCF